MGQTRMTKKNDILVIDLDHTLINSDMMISSIKWLIKNKPLTSFLIPFWLIKGKAYLKQCLLANIKLDVSKLAYNQTLITYIKSRKKSGASIILATASAQYYADEVAKYLDIFDACYGTDASYNLSAKNKADFLIKKYGKHNFDYAGDHSRDIAIWQATNLAIVIGANKRLKQKVQNLKVDTIYLDMNIK